MKGKDKIEITIKATSMLTLPRKIPQKIADFCQRYGIQDGVGVYNDETRTVKFTCMNDTGDPVENRRAIISLMAENGWETKE